MQNPFIAGNWVRGENFFGRQSLIEEVLSGSRNYLWIAGTRRLGKTSLLKQIELLSTEGEHAGRFIPLFWDMQGSQNLDGLKESLLESIEDAEDRFEEIGIDIDELESQDFFGMLRTLRRKTKDENLNLLFLCDEAEELITIEKNNPEALPRLRRFLQRGEHIHTILTATRRLSELEHSSDPNTSPFLYGFIPPSYLTRLEDEEARKLIRRGNFDDRTVGEIMEKCNNHPYLIQLICNRLFEVQDLKKVLTEVANDDMISHFFSVDFKYLHAQQKELLLHILESENLTLSDLQKQFEQTADKVIKYLFELTQLGFVNHEDHHYIISNYFFKKWLEREKEKLYTESELKRASPTKTFYSGASKPFHTPDVGDKLGDHEILERLGSGGMGVVYKGRDIKLGRPVALKILLPEYTADTEFRERFVQEARAASTMNHPNVTTIYQIGEEGDIYYISMEFVDGQTLGSWRQNHGNDLNVCLDIALQASEGLAHAHSREIVHRDIKSDNIMVADPQTVKIMDFGLAKTLRREETRLTKTGTTLGTLSYMSPEQASGRETDHRTDIFSFGVVLYELFTGKLPFDGEYELTILYEIVNEPHPPIATVNPKLPDELGQIIDRALQKDRERRYQSIPELTQALQNLADQL